MAAALGCANAVRKHPISWRHLSGGFKELTLTWTDPATGLPCKGRLDHTSTHLVDLKTAARVSRRQFASAAATLGYHGQLAYYMDGLHANGIEVHHEPILIVVQSEPPHDVIAYRVPGNVIEQGRTEYQRLLEKLRDCLDSGSWPGVAPDDLETFELPAYAYMDDEAVNLTIGGQAIGGL